MAGTYHRGRRWSQAAGGVVVLAVFAYSVLRWRPFRVEIEGPSMAPTLVPGDWALAVPARRLVRGTVVVVEHPRRPGFEMVKRIVAVPGERAPDGRLLGSEEWWLEGDNPAASTDSRHFGPVLRHDIKAKIAGTYWPVARRRLL